MAEQTIHTESTEVMAMFVALQLTFSNQLPGLDTRDQMREEYAKNYATAREAVLSNRKSPENDIPPSGGRRNAH